MGTIIARKRKDGTVGYTAQIRIVRHGKLAHNETQTFDRRQAATAWLKKRESALAEPGVLGRRPVDDPTLREVIDRYVAESERAIGRTKAQVLRSIKKYDIAELRCSEISSTEIVAFAQKVEGKPQTVSGYLSHLGAVFSVARPAWGYQLDQGAFKDAVAVTRRLGVTGNSHQRTRRPSLPELDKLLTHMSERLRLRPRSTPMPQIVVFALFSTRRLEEITRITWADLDETYSRVLVRDMKNPGKTIGNDVWCDLPAEAMRIVKTMPQVAEQIFPFTPEAISVSFLRTVKLLGIENLHFHDLRHEGVTRLFEKGLNIPHVAAVSGHRSWTSLKRYTHIRQSGDKYAGWRWVETLAPEVGS